MIAKWENLSRDQLSALDKDNTIVLLPMSATEQHGPHLPVGTDSIILSTLMDKAIAAADSYTGGNVIFAPQLHIGKSNEHMDFCGTLTFSAQTYYALLHDIAGCIAKHGFKKLVLFNSHGGNTDMANLLSRDLRIDFGLCVRLVVHLLLGRGPGEISAVRPLWHLPCLRAGDFPDAGSAAGNRAHGSRGGRRSCRVLHGR